MYMFDGVDKELLIKELAKELAEDWYAASDWGEDEFTKVMCEKSTFKHQRLKIKMFEATCYYVVQQLMYSDLGTEIMSKVAKARGMHLIAGKREDY